MSRDNIDCPGKPGQCPDRGIRCRPRGLPMLSGMVRNATPKAMALGAKIRSVRENTGLSQRAAAKKLKIGNSTMSRIENGETPPDPAELVEMLEILGATEAESEEILELASDTSGNA